MNEFIFSGNNRKYEDFKKNIMPSFQPLFDSLREYCFSLGNNVIEDVRMHRVVFCKSFTFRYFADLEPQKESILIKIRKNRNESPQELCLEIGEDITETKNLLMNAYNSIH